METVFFAPNNAQVKDTQFIEYHPKIQANYPWKNIKPFVEPALISYVLPHIGRSFHDVLATAANQLDQISAQTIEESQEATIEAPSEEIQRALSMLRRALAKYTVRDMVPEHLGSLSELGFQTMSDREGTSRGASQWVYYTNLRNLTIKGDQYFDQLIDYLEAQVKDENEEFNAYKDSSARQFQKSILFRSTGEMNEYLNIQNSRRAFTTVIPYFRKAEKRELEPVLGEALLASVSAWMNAGGELSSIQEKLIDASRIFIAEAGLIAAIPHVSLVISGDGFQLVSSTDGFTTNNPSGMVSSESAIARLRQDAETRSAGALQDLRSLLAVHSEELAEFGYVAPSSTSENHNIHNSPGAVGIF